MKIYGDEGLTLIGTFLFIIGFFIFLYLLEKIHEKKPIHIIETIYKIFLIPPKSLDINTVRKFIRKNEEKYRADKMNLYQKIVLILGAIVLPIIIWTSPRGSYWQNSFFENQGNIIHFESALIRAILVIGCTLLVFFALKGIGGKKEK